MVINVTEGSDAEVRGKTEAEIMNSVGKVYICMGMQNVLL